MLFYDFYYIYAIAYLLQHGGNPYDINQCHAVLLSIGYPADKIVSPFPYPPWNLWVFYLLGFLSFSYSLASFFIASLVGGTVAGLTSLRAIIIKPEWINNYKKLVFLFTFVPFIKCIFFGQLTWIPFLAIVIAISLLREKKCFIAGIVLSMILLKPHLWLGIYGFILARFIFGSKLNLFFGFLLGSALQFLFSVAIFPFNFHFLWERILASPHIVADAHIISCSLIDIITHMIHFPLLRFVAMITSIVFGFWIGMRCLEQQVDRVLLMRVIPLSILLAPYAWAHDYIALFPFLIEEFFLFTRNKSEQTILRIWISAALVCSMALLFNYESFFLVLLIPILLQWKKILFNTHCQLLPPKFILTQPK